MTEFVTQKVKAALPLAFRTPAAVEYCGLNDDKQLYALVRDGRIDPPVTVLGEALWPRAALDDALSSLFRRSMRWRKQRARREETDSCA